MDKDIITTDTNDTELDDSAVKRPVRHHRRDAQSDKYFKIRNILNIIFMIGALAGVLVLYFYDKTVGTVIILVSMVLKMTECCFRLMRQ